MMVEYLSIASYGCGFWRIALVCGGDDELSTSGLLRKKDNAQCSMLIVAILWSAGGGDRTDRTLLRQRK